jgi:hypothetical protein
MRSGTQAAALEALGDLVATARTHADVERLNRRTGWAQNWDTLASSLDAVRTRLVQEGDDYLEVAWAFVDSGRLTIARHISRARRTPAR